MNLLKKILVAQATVLALWAASAQATTDEEIAQRIKPVGVVCVQGDECAKSVAVAAPSASAGRSAEDIVTKHCSVCHVSGLLGAPIIGETADWQARADAQGGIDGILKTAISGINAMPAKGTCSDCSDDELMSTIKYMSGL
ncbi:MAG TPA: c-type cytochrome [Thiopseudomonas sp.]|nr:c-type cytochrome [Thiopseudomonas sp.]